MGEALADPSSSLFLVFADECHVQSLQTSTAAILPQPQRSRSLQTSPASVQARPNDPNTLQPNPIEKRHHQLAPSVGTTVPLQTKLITQLLMVSTQNTSRSNVNPPRMQDPPGNTDNRPPDTIEAMQANTNEVEVLHLINQRLIGELEQLTR